MKIVSIDQNKGDKGLLDKDLSSGNFIMNLFAAK